MPTNLYALGGIPLPNATLLPSGPRHVARVGSVALRTTVSAGHVVAVDVQPGYLHRGAEKLFEVRDWRSLTMLADRHDWSASFSGELVTTLAVERAMGLIPPPRATWLRTILAELARIHSHLAHLNHIADGSTSPLLWNTVDAIREQMLRWSGNRVHPMLCRVGGIASDAPRGWLRALPDLLVEAVRVSAACEETLGGHALEGLAFVDRAMCCQYGLSGPVGRAAGLDLDRRRSGYLAYGSLDLRPVLAADGDARARFRVLAGEVRASAALVGQLLEGLPGGDVAVRLARRLKVPEGEHRAEVEAPWGIAGVQLVSRGGQTPWRLALRTPSFANVAASLGHTIGDLDK